MRRRGKKKKFNTATVSTLVGRNTEIVGDMTFNGGLHVEGKICGNVTADADEAILILSESGHITGEVKVPNMVINGMVEGDVYTTGHLELAQRARVKGNVYYNLLEMAIGAEVNGNLMHQRDGKPQLEFKSQQASQVSEPQTIPGEPRPVEHNS